jgi:hypothetical protein
MPAGILQPNLRVGCLERVSIPEGAHIQRAGPCTATGSIPLKPHKEYK